MTAVAMEFDMSFVNQQWSGCSNGGKKYFVTLMVTNAELAANTCINMTSTSSVPVATPVVSWSSGNASGNTTDAYYNHSPRLLHLHLLLLEPLCLINCARKLSPIDSKIGDGYYYSWVLRFEFIL
jgi:hypothetical protein